MSCSPTETGTVCRRLVGACGAAVAATAGPFLLPPGDAAAVDGCPDVEVVFARGTAEPPGVGWIGQQFVDALRWRVGVRTFAVYAVNFPALPDYATTVDGVHDANGHVQAMAVDCPATEMVLGGYSRGAALIGYVTEQLPPEVAGHVAAVTLLGKSSGAFMAAIGAPPPVIGPDYAAKTIELCAPGDPICSTGNDGAAHAAYAANGMTVQAADFAAERLRAPDTVPGPPV